MVTVAANTVTVAWFRIYQYTSTLERSNSYSPNAFIMTVGSPTGDVLCNIQLLTAQDCTRLSRKGTYTKLL
jgi:hypothetical protein